MEKRSKDMKKIIILGVIGMIFIVFLLILSLLDKSLMEGSLVPVGTELFLMDTVIWL